MWRPIGLKPRLHDTTCCQTGCQTGCTTRFDNRLYRVNNFFIYGEFFDETLLKNSVTWIVVCSCQLKSVFCRTCRLSYNAQHVVDYIAPVSQRCRRPRFLCGHHIVVLWFLSSFFFSFIPRLISAVADWMSIIYIYTWCGPSAHLECRSEMCW